MAASSGERLNLENDIKRAIELLDKLQRTEYNAWIGRYDKRLSINHWFYYQFIYIYFQLSDVPLQKLSSLQKVLESDFFNAVREVYERVYETVDISGSPDIRASATAKATVAGLSLHWFFNLNFINC